MRQIKFRGQTTIGEKWVYGHLIFWGGNYQIWETEQDGETHNYQVIPETVSQFSGLKDKNDVDIYEGDILQCDNLKIVIQYSGNCFEGRYLGIQKDLFSPLQNKNYLQWQVIGSLHSNPELNN